MRQYTVNEIPDLDDIIINIFRTTRSIYDVEFNSGIKLAIHMMDGLTLHIGDSVVDYEATKDNNRKSIIIYFSYGQKSTIDTLVTDELFNNINTRKIRTKALQKLL
jgi:hypothetical protein